MTLILTYFPCDDKHHDNFCAVLDLMLNSINMNTQIIIGININAQIGTQTCKEHMQVLGLYGILSKYARCKNLIHFLVAHKL